MNRSSWLRRVTLGVLGGALAAPQAAGAHELEPQRQLVHDWAGAFNERKFEKLRALLAPKYINHNPNVPSGAEATIKFLQGVAERLPEAHLTVEDIITEGYKIAARMTLSSKVEGNVNRGTIIDIWRVENGRLAEHWDAAS